MNAAAMAPADESERIKQAALVKFQPDDLFPHLGGLVPADLGIGQTIREGCRLLSAHFKSFLLPIVLLTLTLILTVHFSIWQTGAASGILITTSAGRSDSLLEDRSVSRGLSLLYLSKVVLIICAEVGFPRAVVAAYLKERYGKDEGPDHYAIYDLVLGALFSAWSCWAIFILYLVIALVPGAVFLYLRSSLLGAELTIGLALVMCAVVGAFFIVTLPISALTNTRGFQAAKRSFLLTRGNLKSCFGLYLTFAFVSLVIMVPGVVVIVMGQQLTVSTLCLMVGITIVCDWIINIIWGPCRAVLYLKLRACAEANDSLTP